MTKFGLIRHGLTEWNEMRKAQGISDIPLNSAGLKQAHALAKRLSLGEKWDIIIASDLSRAKETALVISEKLNLPIAIYDSRIREIDCGLIEGTTEEERLQMWGSNWRKLDLGMEKFEDVSKRGSVFLEEAVMAYQDKRILVVSHGALIGLTLRHLLPERFPNTNMENASLTILKNIENSWDCTLYNCTSHLEA
ncbi:histidine phosphatase family protein [Psychrobacillus lasiicapitis]|uniref:Histidine phosphatase family protein n=1 Tax=Psychrobacillus lasiicapitis TaxID=1636719 RepID=A0A544SWR3_9BACI|nr:histidine phosphatase family protein [Psychrobacillus lasiicapitis]TQR09615.1 histidine phosphatase family protein [Psychrobacillus lasiicapitis]GGA29001.1 fructose 1,6-bisphosphatase [Psychrobacillus lasiicapitis]